MTSCSSCQERVGDHLVFCPSCGQPSPDPSRSWSPPPPPHASSNGAASYAGANGARHDLPFDPPSNGARFVAGATPAASWDRRTAHPPPHPSSSDGARRGVMKSAPRSRTTALILAIVPFFLVGIAGVHRFYAGRIITGILQLITGGGFVIWLVIDIVRMANGSFRDAEGRLLLQ